MAGDASPTIETLLPGMSWYTDIGRISFCSILLVTSDDTRIIVDTGHAGRRVTTIEALQHRGLEPTDIDFVFQTHAHWDHVQNFDVFPDAPLLITPNELRYVQSPHPNDFGTPRWTAATLATARTQEVSEGEEIARGVRVIELPGHSAGSAGLLLENEQGRIGIAGDAVATGWSARDRQPAIVFWNEQDSRDSIDKLLAAADLIYPGHDRAFRIVNGQIEYHEPFQLTVSNIDPAQDGLSFNTPPVATFVMPGIESQKL
jgi:glyoxylase-like metal-dependent hydrolase (beta-lactamase superfamily II)